jgi:hypothetical protein
MRTAIHLLVLVALWPLNFARAQEPRPLKQAHAHNDYHHERPLLDALEHGFCSVEADIYLVDGALLVGHDREDLKPDRTLKALYLEPLRQRVTNNGGHVYPDGPLFTLLIDIKSEDEPTYRELARQLAGYAEMLTSVTDGKVAPRAVTVVISGNRAVNAITADPTRYAGLDGRWGDLDSDQPAHLMPMISENWGSHFHWRGSGEMPEAERAKLRGAVHRAHQAGRVVRFWATPENESLWRELVAAQVDLINTDQLARLQKFLTENPSPR